MKQLLITLTALAVMACPVQAETNTFTFSITFAVTDTPADPTAVADTMAAIQAGVPPLIEMVTNHVTLTETITALDDDGETVVRERSEIRPKVEERRIGESSEAMIARHYRAHIQREISELVKTWRTAKAVEGITGVSVEVVEE